MIDPCVFKNPSVVSRRTFGHRLSRSKVPPITVEADARFTIGRCACKTFSSYPMRSTAFIIVIYILFLLTQPCQDVLGAPPSVSGAVNISQGAEDEDCEDGDDGCSPFCICSCRQAPAGYVSIETGREVTVTVRTEHSSELEYECSIPTTALDPIWQPPKH